MDHKTTRVGIQLPMHAIRNLNRAEFSRAKTACVLAKVNIENQDATGVIYQRDCSKDEISEVWVTSASPAYHPEAIYERVL